jgi:hypothetical protein
MQTLLSTALDPVLCKDACPKIDIH